LLEAAPCAFGDEVIGIFDLKDVGGEKLGHLVEADALSMAAR
jgi:hypothetical protein